MLARLTDATEGRVLLADDGRQIDVAHIRREDMKRFRRRVQMIFQDPYESMNPRRTVFDTISEQLRVQGIGTVASRERTVLEMLARVGLSPPRAYLFRIAVMYAGKIVELGPTEDLLEHPLHPYTRALTAAVPVPDPRYEQPEVEIRGGVSKPINPPPICRCRDRCPWGDEVCDANDHPRWRRCVPAISSPATTPGSTCDRDGPRAGAEVVTEA